MPKIITPQQLKNIIYLFCFSITLFSTSCKKDKDDNDDEHLVNHYSDQTGLQTDLYPINNNGLLSYINSNGDIILETEHSYLSSSYFYNDRAQVSSYVQLYRIPVEREEIVGYASIEGIYNEIPYYGIFYDDNEDIHHLYFDSDSIPLKGYKNGDAIIEPYLDIQSWYGYRYGAIDKQGKIIISPTNLAMGRYSKTLLTYTGNNYGEYYYHDIEGKKIRINNKEMVYKSATNFKNHHAITQNFEDSLFIIINEFFETTDTIENYYNSQANGSSWSNVSEFCDLMCRIEHYSFSSEFDYPQVKYGFANTYGKIIIPVTYNYAMDFYNNCSLYESNGLWGYMSNDAEIIIEPQYADGLPFVENISSVKELSGEWILINKKNQLICETRFKATGITSSSLIAFIPCDSEDNLYGFLNTSGEVVIEPQFYSTSFADDGVIDAAFWGDLALVELDQENSAYINKNGEIVWQGKSTNKISLISKTTPKGEFITPHQFKERLNARLKMMK